MSDISAEQFERFISEMRGQTGALNKIIGKLDGKKSGSASASPKGNSAAQKQTSVAQDLARKRLMDDLNSGRKHNSIKEGAAKTFAQNLSRSGAALGTTLRGLDQSATQFGRTLVDATKNFAGLTIVGSVIGSIIDVGEHWIEHYREMANVGQMFNGSMIEMARQAGEAGMPLSEFAGFVKKNSKIMASFGVRDVTALAKSVRQATRSVGMYGFSIDGINDLSAEWLDIQRVMGNRSAATSSTSIRAIDDMAKNVTGLASVFGESREEIIRRTKELSKSNDVQMAVMMNGNLKNNKVFNQTVQAMAAMPEEASKPLMDALMSQINYNNMAYSQAGQDFNKYGLGSVSIALEEWSRGINSQSADGFDLAERQRKKIVSLIEAQMPTLSNLSATDEAAKQMIALHTALQGYDISAAKKRQEQETISAKTSSLMLTIGDRFNEIKGRMLDGIMRSLEKVLGQADEMANSPKWKGFLDTVFMFGTKLGDIITKFIGYFKDPEVLTSFFNTMKTVVDTTITLGGYLITLGTGVLNIIMWFQRLGETLGDSKGGLIGTILGLTAVVTAKNFLKSFVSNLAINAGSVFINGKALGGSAGGGGGFFGGGRGAGAGARGGIRGGGGWGGLVAGLAATVAIPMAVAAMSEAAPPPANDNDPANKETAENTAESVALQKKALEEKKKTGGSTNKIALTGPDGTPLPIDKNGMAIIPIDPENGQPAAPELTPEPATKKPETAPEKPEPAKQKPEEGKPGQFKDPSGMAMLAGAGALGLGALALRRLHSGFKESRYQAAVEDRAARHREVLATKARLKPLDQVHGPMKPKEWDRHRLALQRARNSATDAEIRRDEAKARLRKLHDQRARPTVGARMGKWIGDSRLGRAAKHYGGELGRSRFAGGLRRAGSMAGRIPGAGMAGKLLGSGMGLSALFEGFDYMGENGKALTLKNLAKSGLRVGGGALGAAMGGGAASILTGGAGYYLGGKLGDAIFGEDDMKAPAKVAPKQAQKEMPRPDKAAPPATVDSSTEMLAQSRRQTQVIEERLPDAQKQRKDDSETIQMLKLLEQNKDVQVAILRRLYAEGLQHNSIWNVLKKIDTNTQQTRT